jgi:hypothetical protein
MLIDCDQCAMQHTVACDDCIVTALLGHDTGTVSLGDTEAAALQHLAEAGMVAPLRLVRRDPGDRDAAAG